MSDDAKHSDQAAREATRALDRLHAAMEKAAAADPPPEHPASRRQMAPFPHGPAAPTSPAEMGVVIGEGVKEAFAVADDKLESAVKKAMGGVTHALDRLVGATRGGAAEGEGQEHAAPSAAPAPPPLSPPPPPPSLGQEQHQQQQQQLQHDQLPPEQQHDQHHQSPPEQQHQAPVQQPVSATPSRGGGKAGGAASPPSALGSANADERREEAAAHGDDAAPAQYRRFRESETDRTNPALHQAGSSKEQHAERRAKGEAAADGMLKPPSSSTRAGAELPVASTPMLPAAAAPSSSAAPRAQPADPPRPPLRQRQEDLEDNGGGKTEPHDSMEDVLMMSPSPREPSAALPGELLARVLRRHGFIADAAGGDEPAKAAPGHRAGGQPLAGGFAVPVTTAGVGPDADAAHAEKVTEHARELADSYFAAKAEMEGGIQAGSKAGAAAQPPLGAYHETPSHMGRTWAPRGEPAGPGVGGGTGYPSGPPGRRSSLASRHGSGGSDGPPPPLRETAEAVASSLGAAAGAGLSAAAAGVEGLAQAAGRASGHVASAPATAAENAGYVTGAAARNMETFIPALESALETEGAPFDGGAVVHERALGHEELRARERAVEERALAATRRTRLEEQERLARLRAEAVDRMAAAADEEQQQQHDHHHLPSSPRRRVAEAAEDSAHSAGLVAGHAADVITHALEAVGLGGDEPPPPAEIVASTEEILEERARAAAAASASGEQ